jgi:transposase InsO family protein
VHDDHVNRDFTADTINTKWLVDITEHWTMEGKVCLCAIKDCASNRIVGYAIDSRMTSDLAVSALRMAIILRGRPAGTIVHSDRGVSFVPRSSRSCSATTASSDRWAASPQPETTRQWSRSLPCSRRSS